MAKADSMKPELHFTNHKGNVIRNDHNFIARVDENDSDAEDSDTDSSDKSESEIEQELTAHYNDFLRPILTSLNVFLISSLFIIIYKINS